MSRHGFLKPAAGAVALAALVFASAPPTAAQVRLSGEAGPATVQVMSWRDIPFRTVVRQQHDYSCGSAALATLLTYHYGMKTSEADAFKAMYERGDQAKIRKVGFSMLDMKQYLASQGLPADGFRLTLDEVAEAGTPVIALINLGAYRHFVVIKGVSGDKVLIGDPALGLKVIPRSAFMNMWNGIALAVRDLPRSERPAFNRISEWSPWSRAPIRTAADPGTITALTNNLSPLYQITPVQLIDFTPGS